PALWRAAAAHIKLLERFDITRSLVLVIVGKLHARLDVFQRIYPDAVVVDDALAGWSAGMIDQPGDVAAHVAVDAVVIIECEEESMMASHLVLVVALIRLVVVGFFAGVLDDLLACPDSPLGECAAALDGSPPDLKQRVVHRPPAGAVPF